LEAVKEKNMKTEDKEKVCTGRDLTKALAKTKLSEEEATAWRRDLRNVRKTLKTPADKWR
jgi:hypothetical protein